MLNMMTQVAAPPKTKNETFFEREAWKVLLGVSLLIGFFGLTDMVGGASDLQRGETVLRSRNLFPGAERCQIARQLFQMSTSDALSGV
jgi:hypothetical protein